MTKLPQAYKGVLVLQPNTTYEGPLVLNERTCVFTAGDGEATIVGGIQINAENCSIEGVKSA